MKRIVVAALGILMAVAAWAGPAGASSDTTTNTFYGLDAGHSDVSGGTNDNTFIGASAGYANTTGQRNISLGFHAGYGNVSGSYNSFIGAEAGSSNTSGDSNIFIGDGAGQANTTGFYNTFVGDNAGHVNNGGNFNAFLGGAAGQQNTSGNMNTVVGVCAGNTNQTGSHNVFIGGGAGVTETGSNRLYIDNCTGSVPSGSCSASCTSTPSTALIYGEFDNHKVKINGTLEATGGIKFPDGNTQTTALTGVSNNNLTSLGSGAGSSGNYNTFLGTLAGQNSASGSYGNTFIGYFAGQNNTGGSSNVFIGMGSGYGTSGSFNTFIGEGAGNSNTSDGNIFIGQGAGQTHTTGTSNTFIGTVAGGNHTTGQNNVFIGFMAGRNASGSNKLYIDNCYTGGSCDAPLIYGEFDHQLVNINGTLTVTSLVSASDERYKRNVQPLQLSLDKVTHLMGVSYEWRTDEYKGRGFNEGRQIGLIAQEVEKVLPELVHTDGNGYKAVAYDKLVPVLVEAIKEQQDVIKALQGEMAKLSTEVNRLKSRDISAQK